MSIKNIIYTVKENIKYLENKIKERNINLDKIIKRDKKENKLDEEELKRQKEDLKKLSKLK